MQDELLRTPGSTADMLTALIDYMRRTGSFPPSCLRWTRWALPQLALGFQGAGAPALTTVPENDDART
jgi:hypothetical protein